MIVGLWIYEELCRVDEKTKADALKYFWENKTIEAISQMFQKNDVPYAECSGSWSSQYSPSVLPVLTGQRNKPVVSPKLSSVSNHRDLFEKISR